MKPSTLLAAAAILLVACGEDQALLSPSAADRAAFAANGNPGIAPTNSSAGGRDYGEWAAAWWEWALQTPASVTPILDPTGEGCAAGQRGHVWFLAGSFGSDPVVRHCTVPPGKALFLPLINFASFAFLSDPPEFRTEEFLRGQVTCIEDARFPLVEIDGVPVESPQAYLEHSAVFSVVLPEDNVFGATADDIPELTLSPAVDEGYYLFLTPRSAGEHTIRWQAASDACGFGQDITYQLTVR